MKIETALFSSTSFLEDETYFSLVERPFTPVCAFILSGLNVMFEKCMVYFSGYCSKLKYFSSFLLSVLVLLLKEGTYPKAIETQRFIFLYFLCDRIMCFLQ